MAARELPDAVARPESTSSARTSASAGSAVHNGAIAPHISAKSREAGSGADAREPDVERDARSKDAAADVSFEVTFAENDPLNPRHRYGALRKWSMVLVVSSTSTCVTCTSSLYTQTYGQIQPEFYTSEIIATLGLSLFVAGLGLGPMLLAPLSEFYGRKPVYTISMFFFIIWIIPCGLAQNIQTMLVARFINGFAGSAFLSVAGGTVGDLFSKTELDAPMMIYTASPFLGPEVGPIIGGFVNAFTNWRWSFWLLLIWSGVQLIMILLFVDETYHPVILRNKARKLRKETGDNRWYASLEKSDRSIAQTVLMSCYRPFLLLILEPMCSNLCIFSALLLGIVYLFFGAFDIIFTNNHDFNRWQVGLSFVGILIGMITAISTEPLWHRYYLRLLKQRVKEGGEPGGSEPEYRLPPAVAGAPLVTIGLFWFGWTTYSSVHWIVPIVGSAVFGAGVVLCFSGIFTFLVESYPLYAASALAANSFARSCFAAAFPLFGPAMFHNLGYQWANTLLALLSLVMVPFPYIFFKYGKRIRQGSRFASGSK